MGRPIFHVSTIGWHGAMQCAGGYKKRTYSRTSSIWLKRKVGRQKRTAKELGVLRPRTDCCSRIVALPWRSSLRVAMKESAIPDRATTITYYYFYLLQRSLIIIFIYNDHLLLFLFTSLFMFML